MRAPVDCVPPSAFDPDHPPEAVHEVAFFDDQESVADAPVAIVLGDTERLTLGTGVCTETVTDCAAVPPPPVQVKVYVLLALNAPVDWVPLTALAPDQPPDAEQEAALLADHVRVEPAPLATVDGFALKVTMGAPALTVTVTDWDAVPPVPVQVSPNVAVDERDRDAAEPLTGLDPLHAPVAEHDAAFVELQVRFVVAPAAIAVGLALMVTVGGADFTDTVADCVALPPLPVQVSVKVSVWVSAPVDCVPLTALVPDHPPEAVH
ncbi:MAG TPA: hypothetical protein VHV81_06495 [Steroidobacteraceae bacterium]|nr:hypothetical protein [Steroidobacteraceae bacterium]